MIFLQLFTADIAENIWYVYHTVAAIILPPNQKSWALLHFRTPLELGLGLR